jgi:hypothetical protein
MEEFLRLLHSGRSDRLDEFAISLFVVGEKYRVPQVSEGR